MIVADVFAVHTTEQFLHWKRSYVPTLAVWQRAPRQLIQGIAKGTFKLQPSFLPLCVPSSAVSPSSSPSLQPFVDHLTTDNNLAVTSTGFEDATDHFLFECPPKAAVWQGIISEFLWPTVTIDDIRHSLLTLDFYNIRYSQRPRASSHHTVIIAMSNFWKAHYRLIFDQTSFAPAALLNSIRLDIIIQKMIDEALIHASL
ncbi:uncharacterized protein ATC70_003109 [Mucor velutinosus]|uniref:Uncharacterized protein n=1 Tax=Mucor velutinosus TaxID=708070 RepID=A0AAN7D8D0_9FUNG|nr:hypothetical protein ATC70_003109 [Mucor velutinosus]